MLAAIALLCGGAAVRPCACALVPAPLCLHQCRYAIHPIKPSLATPSCALPRSAMYFTMAAKGDEVLPSRVQFTEYYIVLQSRVQAMIVVDNEAIQPCVHTTTTTSFNRVR